MTEKTPKVFVPQHPGQRVAHARRLLGVREGRDILPPELAELVGVTTNAVYAWEEGTIPGRANLEKLARVLGVTPEWIHYGVAPSITVGGLSVTVDETYAPEALEAAKRTVAEREARKAAPPRPRKRGNAR